ncbi:cation:proton antiporter [Natronobiforma cellulositropha]|uniref:cation:proton antiporter n=1 Tax=Natronobiforma cellulositropha TaxID=1679076 RepID=UPI0021D591C0|nr:cation:proton antiporter [Natronobiforma cellulositropha]
MTDLITTLAIVFVTAGALLVVANHFSLSPVPFYIVAGLITGAFVDQPEIVDLAQWGIAFLVFVFGFRVDFGAVRSVLRDSEAAAVTQVVVVTPAAFGIGLLFGFDQLNALYFAVAAALSSTIVGGGLLEREIRDNLVHGRLASSVHFFDDLLAIAIVLVLSAEAFTPTLVTSKIGYGVLFLAAGLLVYRHGFPLLVRLADGSGELVLMGSISILIGFLAAAELAGISIVVGAFAAGIAIRNDSAVSLEVRNGIESIRDFFVAIFFVTVGALVTVPSLEVLVVAATLVCLVVLVNPFVIMLSFLYEGYDARTAFLASTSLNQVSEFSLVVAIQALLLGTITETVFEAIILAAAVTMILTSFTRRHEETIYRSVIEGAVAERQHRQLAERSSVSDLSDHVVIVGYGRQGRIIVERFERLDCPYVVVENDPVLWDSLREDCSNYVLGDALSRSTWDSARAEAAALIVSTVDHAPVSETVLEVADERDLEADVILRAGDSRAAQRLLEAGATYVSVPNVLAGDQLAYIVEGVLSGETDAATVRSNHVDRLETLERYGFDTAVPDD